MANYDRRFLVPYLQDVCSIELLCTHLENEIEHCNQDICFYTDKVNQKIVDPPYPRITDYHEDASNGLCGAAVFTVIALIGLWIGWNIIGIPIMIYGGIGIFAGVSDSLEKRGISQSRYNDGIRRYNEIVANNSKIRAKIPQYKTSLEIKRQELSALKIRLNEADATRKNIYSVDIIAKKYRDVSVAYYLYDYFNTSRETDLDRIIQTLLLDEIKQQLAKIIAQNEEIILTQRYQIALQEQQNRIATENHRRELQQFARLERNQELQTDYLNMIEANQETTNFFLAADYINKYH